jgi:hypothetical protein
MEGAFFVFPPPFSVFKMGEGNWPIMIRLRKLEEGKSRHAQERTDQKTFINSYHLRHNPTEAENKLWQTLRMHQLDGVHFHRQHAIGPYIVDFCSPKHKLIIKLDGSQHLEQEFFWGDFPCFMLQGFA